jgi:hypothetical protein
MPDLFKEKRFVHECLKCEDCPFKSRCIEEGETKKVIEEKTSTIKYRMANRFTYRQYINIYNKRYQRSESINGYHKGVKQVLLLVSTNELAATNEMNLRNTVYNMKRLKTIRDI